MSELAKTNDNVTPWTHIANYFKDKPAGKFLQIGTKSFASETVKLAYDGWSGVLVEPCAKQFAVLADVFASDDKIDLVNAAVISDIVDPRHLMAYDFNGRRTYIRPIQINELYPLFGDTFELICVDVEGANIDLVLGFYLDKTDMLCIRHDNQLGRVKLIKKAFGFETLMIDEETAILVREVKDED